MKPKNLLPLLLLTCPLTATADTFTLKDGTELEATVLSETADSYVLEVQVTKSIKDERTIAKADVEKVRRTRRGEAEFEPIAKLVPVPDQSGSDEYADRIAQVQRYLTKFKGSTMEKDAEKILATLKKEANEVDSGGIKLNGRIIPAKDYRPDAFEIDARALASSIEGAISKSQFVPALRAFDEMRKKFANTVPFTEVAPLAARAAQTHLAEVKRLIDTFDERAKQRAIGLDRMSSGDRAQTEAAIAEQQAGFAKRLDAEKAAGIGWVSIDPNFRPSLDATMSYGQQVLNQIKTIPSAPQTDAGKLYREAYSLSHGGGDPAETNNAINSAKSAGVGEEYINKLQPSEPGAE